MSLDESLRSAIKSARRREDWAECIGLCEKALAAASPLSSPDEYGVKLTLALALLESDTPKDVEEPYERALLLYEELLQSVSSSSREWASLQRNLGYVYRNRRRGSRDQNIAASIDHYEQALRGCGESDVALRASIECEIGLAYMALEMGSRAENRLKAMEYLRMASCVLTELDYPEEWAQISRAMAELGRKEASG